MIDDFPVPGGGGGTGSGVTRRRYRRRFADELGIWSELVMASTPSVSVTPDAARQILCTAFGSDDTTPEQLDGFYLYATDGNQVSEQRRVWSGTYDGADASILVDRPYSAAVNQSSTLELTSPLPVARYLSIKGLNELIDEGLARCWVAVRLSLTGNGTSSYSLADYPWIFGNEQTAGIFDTRALGSTQPSTLSPLGYRFVRSGASLTLVTDAVYAASETFEFALYVRADRYVSDGTSWAYVTTPGLQGDAWEAAAPEEWVIAFAMVKALEFLFRWLPMDGRITDAQRGILLDDAQRRYPKWVAAANAIDDEMVDPLPERYVPAVLGHGSGDWLENAPRTVPAV